ncbi:MAG: hypothetical protein MZV70_42285 [Desulfobacterales bacterium]|nr:hypothetical protein [Desulfobacterales bacterium]
MIHGCSTPATTSTSRPIKRSIETLQKNGLALGHHHRRRRTHNPQELRGHRAVHPATAGSRSGSSRTVPGWTRLPAVAEVLEEGDWLRISLDAGKESTFFKSHRPRGRISSREHPVQGAREIKKHSTPR